MIIRPNTAGFRKATSRLRQIINSGQELLRASWLKMAHHCGKSNCRCARGKRYYHINWYISQSKNGKQRMKCVPKEYIWELKAKTEAYKEARDLLATIGDEYWNEFVRRKK